MSNRSKMVVINGVAKSGKDTFIDFFRRNSNRPVLNESTIDPVKQMARIMGWNGEKDDKSRMLLSKLKRLWTDYNDGIFKTFLELDHSLNPNVVMFLHCREPEEIDKFKKNLGRDCVTLLIRRDESNVVCPNNPSDLSVEEYEYDLVIDNNSTLEAFEAKAKKIAYLDWFGTGDEIWDCLTKSGVSTLCL